MKNNSAKSGSLIASLKDVSIAFNRSTAVKPSSMT